jgi:hypothetical protein
MKALLHEIIAGADIRLDRVRARQVIDLFWIRPAFWPKDHFPFFEAWQHWILLLMPLPLDFGSGGKSEPRIVAILAEQRSKTAQLKTRPDGRAPAAPRSGKGAER